MTVLPVLTLRRTALGRGGAGVVPLCLCLMVGAELPFGQSDDAFLPKVTAVAGATEH